MKTKIQEEIKKIKDLDTLSEMKNYIDNELKTREQVINLCNEANSLKKINNFGFVKESMEVLSPALFKTKSGRNLINSYINEVKNNKTLSSLHSLFEGLRKLNSSESVNLLINEWNEEGRYIKSEYNSGMKELNKIISESYILSGMPIETILKEENIKYNDAIMNVIKEAKNKKGNLGDYFNNINFISEEIKKRKVNESFNEKIEEFDNIISNELSSNKVNEEKYDKEKEKCIKGLNEAIEKLKTEGDFETCGRIELFIEGIQSKTFSQETASEDIEKFKELTECFN